MSKEDYVEEAFKKVVKIHKNLPSGGILVFLTGKKEITYLCKRLELALKKRNKVGKKRSRKEAEDDSDSVLEEEGRLEEELDVQIMPLYS